MIFIYMFIERERKRESYRGRKDRKDGEKIEYNNTALVYNASHYILLTCPENYVATHS